MCHFTHERVIHKGERIREFLQVMQKQLLLFHNAVAGYFSGNQTALDATMKQFAIKVLVHFYSRTFPEPTWHPFPTFCHLGSLLDPCKQCIKGRGVICILNVTIQNLIYRQRQMTDSHPPGSRSEGKKRNIFHPSFSFSNLPSNFFCCSSVWLFTQTIITVCQFKIIIKDRDLYLKF